MIEIIPAIDLINGQCVRLKQGNYKKKTVYNDNPLEVAKSFEDSGIKRLHLVDLDGARKKHVVNLKSLEKIASGTNLTIDFGGGIKTDKDIDDVFNAGAEMVTVGSVAITNSMLFEKWITKYGSNKIILGADVKNYQIAIGGWLNVTNVLLFDFLTNFQNKGGIYVLCTDISKDGMLKGSSVEMYEEITKNFKRISLIASGGISKMEDIIELDEMGVYGVVVGKAIYEGRITTEEIAGYILNHQEK